MGRKKKTRYVRKKIAEERRFFFFNTLDTDDRHEFFSELVALPDVQRFSLNTRGLRRGRMPPTCGSPHAGNGRGCKKIELMTATVLPRGARRFSHG